MPVDRYMARKQRTTKVHFALIGGPEADTSPGVTPVLDSNNVVPSPNGTEMSPRDGIEIRKRYRLTTTPTAGRKALVVETQPPDVQLGFLFMIIDTANGGNKIEKGQFMRDRTQLPFESTVAVASFFTSSESITATTPWFLDVDRSGFLDGERTISYKTRDGTAVAGVDYIAADAIITLPPGDAGVSVSGPATLGPGVDKFFFIDLYDPGPGVAIGTIGTMVINITI